MNSLRFVFLAGTKFFSLLLFSACIAAVVAWPRRDEWKLYWRIREVLYLGQGGRDNLLWLNVESNTNVNIELQPVRVVPLTLEDWDIQFEQFLRLWDPSYTIVILCDGYVCNRSKAVALALLRDMPDLEIFISKEHAKPNQN